MSSKSNQDLLRHSIETLEVMGDPAYLSEKIVIPADPSEINDLLRRNRSILEHITAYKVAMHHKNKKQKDSILNDLLDLLAVSEINVSEFVTFWATLDVTYSGYSSLPRDEQKIFLQRAVETYIAKRHELYSAHGYSATTLQVRQDSFAHKAYGTKALTKLTAMFETHRFKKASSLEELVATKRAYIFPDATDAHIFDNLLQKMKLKFEWSSLHQGKRPDAAFMLEGDIYLLEHKHKKESGGGQNGQLSEIISFIQSKERKDNVHYVSFLDGIYFNELVTVTSKKSKVFRQLEQINAALKQNKKNYFVNTAGLDLLLT